MLKTIEKILKEKVIVIVRGVAREDLLPFAEAVYRGGIRLLECTFDATGTVTDEQIADNIKMLVDHFGDKMLIGAGTVLTEKQVELVKSVGGKFIISPDTNPDIIRKTKEMGLVSIPGAFTPSEAAAAHRAGADFVKDVKAPLSHIRFLAVGGVNADNMAEYHNAGALGFGIGSDIVNKKHIADGNFTAIEASARKYIDALERVQK